MITIILIVIVLWLVAFVAALLAVLFLVLGERRRWWLPGLLALTGTAIGVMGLASWTPFVSFPEIGYTRSSGTFEISLRSRWLFTAPVVLGGIGLVLALWQSQKQRPMV